jgi:hypothetical protein
MAAAGSACVARRESRRRQAQTSAVGRVHTRDDAEGDDDDDAGDDDDEDAGEVDEDEDGTGDATPADDETGARKRDESTLIDLRRKIFVSSVALSPTSDSTSAFAASWSSASSSASVTGRSTGVHASSAAVADSESSE